LCASRSPAGGGRDHALPHGVQGHAQAVLAHRLLLTPAAGEAERASMTAEDAGEGGPVHAHRSEYEDAVDAAEGHFLEAREAWHAERGDIAPPRERIAGRASLTERAVFRRLHGELEHNQQVVNWSGGALAPGPVRPVWTQTRGGADEAHEAS